MDDGLGTILEITKPENTERTVIRTDAYRYLKDPESLTNAVKISYWIIFFISIIAIISNIIQLDLINKFRITRVEAEANDTRQIIIFIIALIAGITNRVLFFVWVYRANLNCHGFNAQGMQFTPGWSVGWFFIPFANLFKPFQVIKEIWHVSDDPQEWQKNKYHKSSFLPGFWWCLWLLSGTMSFISYLASRSIHTRRELETSTILAIIIDIALLPMIIVFITLIKNIYERQENLVKSGTFSKAEYFCSECNTEVNEEDKFCSKCGANLEQ